MQKYKKQNNTKQKDILNMYKIEKPLLYNDTILTFFHIYGSGNVQIVSHQPLQSHWHTCCDMP